MQRAKHYGFLTMVFLVALRLVIGWHFFFEGAHKLDTFVVGTNTSTNKVFSSAGYFREAPGPLAWEMRKYLGDPDDDALARVTPLPGDAAKSDDPAARMPPALRKEWDDSFNQFVKFYGLDANQEKEAKANLDKAEADVVRWLTIQAVEGKSKDKQPTDVQAVMTEVEKTYPSGVLKVQETPAQRIAEYRDKVQEYRNMLDKTDAAFNSDVVGLKRLATKGEAASMRKSLMADLDKKTAALKASWGDLLTDSQANKGVPLPSLPLLWWVDGITAWGLTVIGGCLLLGLLTRFNCILAAGFLLMTYFASPPWPWLPTPPNNEGNYHYVNKNLVEMFALLVLATTASGRWFGVDALISWTLAALFGRRVPQPAPVRRAA
ncbi:MAG TPA: hypothetical protein DDY78_21835 [Planctomycetales bacterium]|jgi:uncharacterized membrane protein YphA (DoxX/SURF4 family)|nr:hypothetical protein [Planctomycetales bacterium]